MTIRRRLHSAAIALVAVATLTSAPALAQDGFAPPGNSAVDEYVESVPSAGGPRHRDGSRSDGPDNRRGSSVPSSTSSELADQGADGVAALAAAEAEVDESAAATSTGGETAKSKGSKPQRGGGKAARSKEAQAIADAAQERDPSVPAALVQAAAGGDGSGMGVLMPAILAASILAAGGVLFSRARDKS